MKSAEGTPKEFRRRFSAEDPTDALAAGCFSGTGRAPGPVQTFHPFPHERAGVVSGNCGVFDAVALLRDAVASVRSCISCKSVVMDFVSDRESLHILSDAAMLGSLAVYLLSSAAQNTARGRIALILNVESSLIRMTVTDTGCGIPQKKHMVASRARDGKGPSGCESGLVIARRLLELSGGTLDVASKAGEGAIVQVALPVMLHEED